MLCTSESPADPLAPRKCALLCILPNVMAKLTQASLEVKCPLCLRNGAAASQSEPRVLCVLDGCRKGCAHALFYGEMPAVRWRR